MHADKTKWSAKKLILAENFEFNREVRDNLLDF